jgi:CheY-like chemotaxis protein
VNQPARIFLVDDQAEMALIVGHLVRRGGHELAACTDVESAWRHLQTAAPPPSLVLLDINLPGLSGLELCRRLLADATHADLPVAVFSQWECGEEIHAALRTGADFVVPKDLVAHPEAWRERLTEIFRDLQDRGSRMEDRRSQGLSFDPRFSILDSRLFSGPIAHAEEWLAALEEALARLPLRPLQPDLMLLLARRRLQVYGTEADPGESVSGVISALDKVTSLLRNSSQDSRPIAVGLDAQQRLIFTFALAEQLRYTFGTTAVAAFQHALARALPRRDDSSKDPGRGRDPHRKRD